MSKDKKKPRNWAQATIADLIGTDGVFVDGDWVESKDQDPNGDIRLIQLADIGDGYFANKSNRYLTSEKAIKLGCTFLNPRDVLIARMPDPLGRSCIFPGDKKVSVTVVDVCIVRDIDENFYNRWLMYFVNSPKFRQGIYSLQSGSTRKRISRGNLSTLTLPVPPRKEQTRIVEKLEELLSDLDAGVAELKAAQKKLTQYRQSLLKAAVEGALTAEWRAERAKRGEPLETGTQLLERILAERRRHWEEKQLAKFKEQGKTPPKDWRDKYPEPVKPNIANLPELPDGWIWASAEQICDFITKGTTPPKNFLKTSQKFIPFLRVTNLTNDGSLNFNDQVFISEDIHLGLLGRSIVYPGDVLMNIVGPPLGQVSIVPADFPEWNINQAIAVFRPIGGIFNYYICSFLLSDFAQKWLKFRSKTTAGQTNLTLEVCRSLPVSLPSIEEQSEIRQILEYALTEANSQANDIELMLKQSSAQRQNILKAAFSGQLVPQDPNDEPASVLLERIRAERAARESGGRRRGRKAREDAA